MTAKAKVWTSLGSISGIVIGGLLGMMIPSVMIALGFLGDVFLGGLTVLSFVIVTTTLINSVSGLGATSKFRLAFFKNLSFWGITLVFGIMIALGVGKFVLTEATIGSAAFEGMRTVPGTNSGTAVFWLGSILLAIGMGLTAIKMKIKARSLMSWFKNFGDGLNSLVGSLTYILPVGLLFATANYVARDGYPITNLTWFVGNYVLAAVIGLALLGFVVMPLILLVISGVNPFKFYGKLIPAILTAFGTMSSRLTLPFVISALEDDKQTDKRATSLATGLGTIFNVAPTVLLVILSTMFLANVTGTTISLVQLLLIGITAAGLSIGVCSGVGMIVPVIVGAISLTGDFQALSPALALVVSVTWLLEPVRAVFNTIGDGVSAAVLSQVFEFKTALRSPARTAPTRRFGSDKPSQSSDRRGRRPDQSSSSRSHSPRSEQSSDRSAARSRTRGHLQKDSRDTKSSPRSKTTRDSASKDQKRSNSATRQTKEAVNSPFNMDSGGEPALDMNIPATVQESSSDQASTRPRTPKKERPARKTERRSTPRVTDKKRSVSRSPKESVPSETIENSSVEKNSMADTPDSKSQAVSNKSANESQTNNSSVKKSSLTKSRIEGELARVSEQLRRMDDNLESTKELKPATTPVEPSTSPLENNQVETKPEPSANPIENKPAKTPTEPIVTTQAETITDTTDQSMSEKSSEPETESDAEVTIATESNDKPAGISDEEKQLAASFGRSRDRNQAVNNQPSLAETSDDEGEPESPKESLPPESKVKTNGNANKEIGFGRTKRKKRLR